MFRCSSALSIVCYLLVIVSCCSLVSGVRCLLSLRAAGSVCVAVVRCASLFVFCCLLPCVV